MQRAARAGGIIAASTEPRSFRREVRTRRAHSGAWQWELIMADGHVVQGSELFEERSCARLKRSSRDCPFRGLWRAASRDGES